MAQRSAERYDNLSPAYRHRLERGGIGRTEYIRGDNLSAARGHESRNDLIEKLWQTKQDDLANRGNNPNAWSDRQIREAKRLLTITFENGKERPATKKELKQRLETQKRIATVADGWDNAVDELGIDDTVALLGYGGTPKGGEQ